MAVTAAASCVDSRGVFLFLRKCNILDQNCPEITPNCPESPGNTPKWTQTAPTHTTSSQNKPYSAPVTIIMILYDIYTHTKRNYQYKHTHIIHMISYNIIACRRYRGTPPSTPYLVPHTSLTLHPRYHRHILLFLLFCLLPCLLLEHSTALANGPSSAFLRSS